MFNWLFRKSTFYRFHDSFALKHEAMMTGMLDAIQDRVDKGDCVFLMTHFQKTFQDLQKRLEDSKFEFAIVTDVIDTEKVKQLAALQPNQVYLTMAQMLKNDLHPMAKVNQPELAVVVCERHPMPKYDAQISSWCHKLMFPVQLGYFLSLEDPVVSYVVPGQVKMLLEQFGVGENEMVTSSMVSKRLNSVLKRKAAKLIDEVHADSPTEWLERNYA